MNGLRPSVANHSILACGLHWNSKQFFVQRRLRSRTDILELSAPVIARWARN